MTGTTLDPATRTARARPSAIAGCLMLWCVLAGCGGGATVETATSSALSEQGLFRIEAHSDVEPVPVNALHTWTVRVETPEGEPVEGASLVFDGDMPEHQHGLPTRPRVTEELGQGSYRVEGVRFSMPGRWEIYVSVLAGERSDTATLSLELAR